MSDVFWVGRQRTRAQVGTLTVNTASTGGTITVTVGGVRSVVVTPSTTNTTTTAAEIAAACVASPEGEFKEITWTSALAVVTFTGPADGRPVTVAKADGGSNSTTLAATATAPLSPNDAADGANYSTGAVPIVGARLVFQGDVPDVLWNLAALTNAITAYRAASHTGRIGLPAVSDNGYPEYRARHLELAAVTITVELNQADRAGQLRLKGTSASACTFTVTGPGSTARPGEEAVEAYGFASTTAVRVVGGSLALCPDVGQAAVVDSVTGTAGTLTLGPGLTVATPVLDACAARVLCSWSGTFTADGGSSVEVAGAAAGTTTVIQSGRVAWRSTGGLGDVTIGPAGVLDLSAAPAAVAAGTLTRRAGGAVVNPWDRVARPYTLALPDSDLADGRVSVGAGRTITVS